MSKRKIDFGDEPIIKTPKPNTLTREQCQSFINNPTINPITGNPLTLITLQGNVFEKIQNDCNEYHITYSHLIDAIMNSALMSDSRDKKKMCVAFLNKMTYINNIIETILPFTQTRIIGNNTDKRDKLYQIKHVVNKCIGMKFIILTFTPFKDPENRALLFKFIINIQDNYRIEIVENSLDMFKESIRSALSYHPESLGDDSTIAFLKSYKKILENLFIGDILTTQQREDLEEYYEEIKAFFKGYKLSASITSNSSPLRSSNRSKSLVPKTEGLEPLPKATRKELIEKLTHICIDDKDALTQEEFKDMKKKDLQTIVQIGNKNKKEQKNCYNVKILYNYIRDKTKNNQLATDPLNPSHIISTDELFEIHRMIKYHKKDARHPTDIDKLKYPKIILKFIHLEDTEYYQVFAARIIDKREVNNTLIGYIPDIDTGDADINTGVLIVKLNDLCEKGRLFNYEYLPYFYLRIPHTILNGDYWEQGDKIEKLRSILNNFHLY